MRVLFEFARERPWASVGLLLCLTVAGAVEGLGLSSVLPLVNVAIQGGAQGDPSGLEARLVAALGRLGLEPTLGVLLSVVTGAFMFKAALLLWVRRQVGYTIERVVTALRLRLLRAVLRADWRFYVRKPIGAFTNSYVSEANRAGAAYMDATWVAFKGLQLVIYGGIAFATSWRVAAVAFLVAVGLAGGLGSRVRAARRAGARQTKLLRALLARLTDLLQAVKPLKAMGRAEAMMPLLERDTLRMQRARLKEVFAKEALAAIQEPFVVGIIAAGFFVGIGLAGMELPRVLMLAVLIERAYSALTQGQKRYQKVVVEESAYWALRRSIEEAEAQAERVATGKRVELRHGIELEDVLVRHGEHEVFRAATLSIPAGQVTALTGPSGAGKTTLADVVAGLVPADAGCVRIDGVPMDEIDLPAWRRSIGYVPQDPTLLHDTVAMNVTLGETGLTRADVERALREAHAWEFVERLPEGMDAVVGERGLALSGGQRQRISIARALAHRPSLLILDEATTALDPASEAAVLAAVRELRGRTTVLAISHQPALLGVSDRVYHVAEGRVSARPLALAPGHEVVRAAGAGGRP
jgi:ATP-binding cassette subfamily C protein